MDQRAGKPCVRRAVPMPCHNLCTFIPLWVNRRIKRSSFRSKLPKIRSQSLGLDKSSSAHRIPSPTIAPRARLQESSCGPSPAGTPVQPCLSSSSSGFPRRTPMGTRISFSLHPSSDKHSTAHDTHLMQNSRTRMKYEMLMMSSQSHSL